MTNSAQTLKESGFKVTPARQAILSVFAEQHEPIDAEFIFKYIQRAEKNTTRTGAAKDINLVTIYRTLTSLEKAGIVKRVDLRKGSISYELADTHHHHIVCTSCGCIEDFDMCEVEGVARAVLKNSKNFIQVSQHSFELFGTCKKCANKAVGKK
ncbi:MAG: hypothetical protein RIT04_588 [Candidatus Parcubacteria bacterium]|jgi:Fur family ferric uptake transcriptional regulator